MHPNKRVFHLTRSSFAGQQRTGGALWSGDTRASWITLERQIYASVNYQTPFVKEVSGLSYLSSATFQKVFLTNELQGVWWTLGNSLLVRGYWRILPASWSISSAKNNMKIAFSKFLEIWGSWVSGFTCAVVPVWLLYSNLSVWEVRLCFCE